ncbi:T9SS type A sorting domain-containing protein [Fulvivirga ligni]|uniref:T9SS type A sorting domain-containing protein n=1 Tax=Fulvivirga ligni TaxID=2904246 RepID=UPI001F3ECA69|nr:T9SS type A sorting domain-containing protein [Fulvivirga ligni]UII24052.1 T9SS type A sorting domain-containing protein [Fulvivirga ligni]
MSALIKTACFAACLVMATFLSVASANAITLSGSDECLEYDNPPSPGDDDSYVNSYIRLLFHVSHESCPGANDGEVFVWTLGNGSYEFPVIWNTGATTSTISNLSPGMYTVTAYDSAGNQTRGSVVVYGASEQEAEVDLESVCSDDITLDINGNSGEGDWLMGSRGQYSYSYDGENYTNLALQDEKERIRGEDEVFYTDMLLTEEGSLYTSFSYTHFFGTVELDPSYNSYLVKANKSNEIEWSQGLTKYIENAELSKDEEGNIYWAFGSLAFSWETIGGEEIAVEGVTLVKLSPDGEYIWHRSWSDANFLIGLSTDYMGNVYLATESSVYKYSKTGVSQWVKEYGYSEYVSFEGDVVQFDANPMGEVYLAVATGDYLTIDSDTVASDFGMAVASLTTDGDLRWAETASKSDGMTYVSGLKAGPRNQLAVALDIRDDSFAYDYFSLGGNFGTAVLKIDAINGQAADNYVMSIYSNPDYHGFSQITGLALDINGNLYVAGENAPGEDTGDGGIYLYGYDVGGSMVVSEEREFKFLYMPTPLATNRNDVAWATFSDMEAVAARKMQIMQYGPQSQATIPYDGQSQIFVKNVANCTISVEIKQNEYKPLPICYISQANSNNVIHWSDDVEGTVDVYKETTAYGEFEYVATSSAGLNYWQDVNSNANIRSYRYKIKPSDECEAQDFSGAHKTLHLTANLSSRGETNLVWEKYEGLEYKSFLIYSGYSPQNMEFVTEIPANLFTYTADYSVRGPYFQIAIEADLDCEIEGSASGAKVAQGESGLIKSNIINTLEVDALHLFPVPAKEYVNVVFKEDGSDYQLKMFDVKGAVRYQATVNEAVQIPVNSLTPGLYTISLINASGKAESRHVVVE